MFDETTGIMFIKANTQFFFMEKLIWNKRFYMPAHFVKLNVFISPTELIQLP